MMLLLLDGVSNRYLCDSICILYGSPINFPNGSEILLILCCAVASHFQGKESRAAFAFFTQTLSPAQER